MNLLAFVIAITLSGYIGYKFSVIEAQVKELQTKWEARKKPAPATGTVVDPFDVAANVRREHEETLRRLNP